MSEIMNKGILIVEDESTIRSYTRRLLEESGYTNVYEADSLSESLSILSEKGENIYVVLLDLRLSDGNGLTLMEHLTNSFNFIIGVIVITGYASLDSATLAINQGVYSYLCKPLQITEFFIQVEKAIASRLFHLRSAPITA